MVSFPVYTFADHLRAQQTRPARKASPASVTLSPQGAASSLKLGQDVTSSAQPSRSADQSAAGASKAADNVRAKQLFAASPFFDDRWSPW